MGAHASGVLTALEHSELIQLASTDPVKEGELQVLEEIARLSPLDVSLRAKDYELINSALASHLRPTSRRKVITLPTAALVLLPLAAVAAVGGYGYLSPEKTSTEDEWSRSPQERVSVPRTAEPEEAPRIDVEALPEAPDSTEPPALLASAVDAQRPTAAELLARAQQARAAKQYSKAAQTYARLIRGYPSSPEASLANLSVAQLQLVQGEPAAALKGFNAYERSGGPFSREAHYGKIQALGALGRTTEERLELRRFVSKYPDSIHVSALTRRLSSRDGEP